MACGQARRVEFASEWRTPVCQGAFGPSSWDFFGRGLILTLSGINLQPDASGPLVAAVGGAGGAEGKSGTRLAVGVGIAPLAMPADRILTLVFVDIASADEQLYLQRDEPDADGGNGEFHL